MEKLPLAELRVMQALWAADPLPLTSRTVMELAGEARGWKIQTVSTLLSRLVTRGFLASARQGRELRYQILVSEDEYLEWDTADFVATHNRFALRDLVAAFVRNEGLTAADVDDLSSWLDEQKKTPGSAFERKN